MTQENNHETTKKRILVQLRTSKEDKQKLVDLAKDAGMNITDFVKSCTLNKQPRTRKANFDREIMIKLLADLSKIGSNINQIAKVMNTEKNAFYSVAVKETLIAQTLTGVSTLSSEILKQLVHGSEG